MASDGLFGSLIRLLPGLYDERIAISSGTMTIIGTGAILRPITQDLDAFEVRGASNVAVHRLEIDGANPAALILAGIRCEGSGASFPRLLFRDSRIHPFIVVKHARAMIQNSLIGYELYADQDATLEVDRVHFRQTRGLRGTVGSLSSRADIRITNSIFEDVNVRFNQSSTLDDTSKFYVGFSTFVGSRPLECRTSSLVRLAVFENNILVSTSSDSSPVVLQPGHNCALINNLAYPQVPPLDEPNINVNPLFVDVAVGNYRLQPGSPAIDRAAPGSGAYLDHDFAGRPRPSGMKSDLGAFEITP
jgi:hypothetical protein